MVELTRILLVQVYSILLLNGQKNVSSIQTNIFDNLKYMLILIVASGSEVKGLSHSIYFKKSISA